VFVNVADIDGGSLQVELPLLAPPEPPYQQDSTQQGQPGGDFR
jgi:hypothetical protein